MRLVLLVYQLCLVFRAEAQLPDACINSDTNRAPGQCYLQPPPPLWASFLLSHSSWLCPAENSDISVMCGTQYMDLSIYICPVYHALYNESLMVVNNVDKPECYGTAVWNVDPPLLTFRFPINESAIASCNNTFTVVKVHFFLKCIDIDHRGTSRSPTDNQPGWNRAVRRLLQRPVCQHLWCNQLHRPLLGHDHLQPAGPVQVLLPLPDAVPPEQHQIGRVS